MAKRLAKSEREKIQAVREATPLTFVVPPLADALETVQNVIGVELAHIARDQRTGARLDASDAKKIASLTDALCKATSTKRDLTSKELGEMTSDELEAELLKELESIRAKRSAE